MNVAFAVTERFRHANHTLSDPKRHPAPFSSRVMKTGPDGYEAEKK